MRSRVNDTFYGPGSLATLAPAVCAGWKTY